MTIEYIASLVGGGGLISLVVALFRALNWLSMLHADLHAVITTVGEIKTDLKSVIDRNEKNEKRIWEFESRLSQLEAREVQ